MLAEVKGVIQGNIVVIEDDDIREYDGAEVVVTLLNDPKKKTKKSLLTGTVLLYQANGGKT